MRQGYWKTMLSLLGAGLLLSCGGGGGGGGGGGDDAMAPPPYVPHIVTHPLYAVSLDDLTELRPILESLEALPQRPTVRVVFDPDTPLSDYQEALPHLYAKAFVMGEVLDSGYFPNGCGEARCDTAQYRARTRALVKALGPYVDIWEIANEINGEWLRPHPEGTAAELEQEAQAIAERVQAAFDEVKAAGGKTAITLWYNDDGSQHCWKQTQDSWAAWVDKYFPATLREQVDYAWFSYYPLDGCPGLKPQWEQDFDRLGQLFPKARLGFGELGTEELGTQPEQQRQLIRDYYPLVKSIKHPRFVGGVFWWNYVEQMLPWRQSTLWQELKTSWEPLPKAQ